MRLTVEGVTVRLERTAILHDVDLVVEPGEFLGLVGPNGSGKSTLLRTLYRALRPVVGTVHVGGDDLWRLTARESARRTAVVVQEGVGEFDLTVSEVVATGRNPHLGPLDRESPADQRLCRDALERVGMTAFASRRFTSLSGGEKQRVQVARALAQQGRVLVLDEPTNHLDIRFQLELLDLVRDLCITTIAAMHDLNLATRFCDRIAVLRSGTLVAAGRTEDVLTTDLVSGVFGVALCRLTDPATGHVHLGFDRLTSPSQPPTDACAPAQ